MFPSCVDCKQIADPLATCETCRKPMCDECATAHHELCPECRPAAAPDPTYRYALTRVWDLDKPVVAWVCLNPSTATADTDDPTVRKIRGFSERWGFGAFVLVNLFPLRATSPKDLFAVTPRQRMGPCSFLNSKSIEGAFLDARDVVFAWGANGFHPQAHVHKLGLLHGLEKVRPAGRRFWHLGLTRDGEPRHPGRIGYDTERQPWAWDG